MNSKERMLAMFDGKPVDHLPVMPITMMFAAGQAGVKYRDYAMDYRVLVSTQLTVSEKFDFDYVTCISDPGREAADLGAKIEIFEDHPPAIVESEALLTDKTTLLKLKTPDPLGGGRMHDRVKAAALFKEKVGNEKLIEGWIEGPCAEAADLRGINHLMTDFYDDPQFVKDLFEFNNQTALVFAKAQIDAGVDMIGVGDAAASLVGPQIYKEFVWPYEIKLMQGLRALGTRIRLHICGKTHKYFKEMGALHCDTVDLDWMNPISQARAEMGPDQVLSGNIDPVAVVKNSTAEQVWKAIQQCHHDAGARYIAAAGCEIPLGTPEENLRALVEYAKTHKAEDF